MPVHGANVHPSGELELQLIFTNFTTLCYLTSQPSLSCSTDHFEHTKWDRHSNTVIDRCKPAMFPLWSALSVHFWQNHSVFWGRNNGRVVSLCARTESVFVLFSYCIYDCCKSLNTVVHDNIRCGTLASGNGKKVSRAKPSRASGKAPLKSKILWTLHPHCWLVKNY